MDLCWIDVIYSFPLIMCVNGSFEVYMANQFKHRVLDILAQVHWDHTGCVCGCVFVCPRHAQEVRVCFVCTGCACLPRMGGLRP